MKPIKNILSKSLLLLCLCCMMATVVSCDYEQPKVDPSMPEPLPHCGTYVCGNDTLFFKGDGRSIRWKFSLFIPGIGYEGQGQYAFLHRFRRLRYDRCELLEIVQDSTHQFYFNVDVSHWPNDSVITLVRFDKENHPSDAFVRVD